MAFLEIKIDDSELVALEKYIKAAGPKVEKALQRAVNRVGDTARTKVVKALSAQTSVTQKAIKKYIVARRAAPGQAAVYRIVAKSPAMSLKEFGPEWVKRGGTGVRVKVWGKRQVFQHAFILPQLGGHVFVRAGGKRVMVKGRFEGKRRQPIKKLWGPVISNEMMRGASLQAFTEAAAALPARLKHELLAILSGHAPS